jgi:hypothetical protein
VVEVLRQTVLNGESVTEPAREIESALSDLDHRFQARTRFLTNQQANQPTNELSNKLTNQPKEV